MVTRKNQIRLIASLLLLACGLPLFSAQNPVISLDILPTATYLQGSWSQVMGTRTTASVKSAASGNVRGELSLTYENFGNEMLPADDIIDKAYLKARFPSYRLTMGKTRLSWGEGTLFNAGDLLFNSNSTDVDLTQSELRSETKWLVAANIPFDAFSFAELVVLPTITTGPMADLSFGGRVYATFGSLKAEIGAGRIDGTGKAYVGVQGNLGADWHLTTSLDEDGDWDVTGGLFYPKYIEGDRSLALRFEFLLRPLGDWKTGSFDAEETRPLLVYPEISYTASQSLSFSLRSVISLLDLSAATTFATSWNVFEGFSLIGYVTASNGNLSSDSSSDSFSFSVSAGASWIF